MYQPSPQLTPEQLADGLVRAIRGNYRHRTCGTITTMCRALALDFARHPAQHGALYCCYCRQRRGAGEFEWADDHTRVGS